MNIVGEIKHYLGDDYAILKFSESRTSFSIDIVSVPAAYRNRGIGTLLIRHVLSLADAMQKDVMVSARPIGTSNEETLQRLVRYYERFGFREFDRGLTVVYMRRRPGDVSSA